MNVTVTITDQITLAMLVAAQVSEAEFLTYDCEKDNILETLVSTVEDMSVSEIESTIKEAVRAFGIMGELDHYCQELVVPDAVDAVDSILIGKNVTID
jgi:hypothetical protein